MHNVFLFFTFAARRKQYLDKIYIKENFIINNLKTNQNYEKKFKETQKYYSSVWNEIWDKLDYLVNLIYKQKIENKLNLTTDEIIVKNSLERLKSKSKQIKIIWDLEFESKKDLDKFLKGTINDIKSEIKELKNHL